MTIENFDWQAAEDDVNGRKPEIETITPDDDYADAGAVLVDDAVAHAAWDAPTTDKRAPILPAWATSRTGLLDQAARYGRLAAYRCAYHAVRFPLYSARLLAWAPVGTARLTGAVWHWASDAEGRPARADAVAGHDWQAYQSLARLRDRRVRWRGIVCAATGLGLAATGTALALAAPPVAVWGTGTAVVAGLGLLGKPGAYPFGVDTVLCGDGEASLPLFVVDR
ncbi:hypothetical protein [Glycomyces tenuis]|uniref:hypothetical protein n=1 Tax=Glycomyces tenuis TaxID=58116 RepID=UPI00047CB74F|nr:hypothetical protein [Glycomyces tenuis]